MFKKLGFVVFLLGISLARANAMDGRESLVNAVLAGDLTGVRSFVEAGADINEGELLCYAARMGFTDIVRYFIGGGIDLNQKEFLHGDTALHLVAKNDIFIGKNDDFIIGAEANKVCLDIMAVLVEAGADLTRKDNAGKTPLQVAKAHKKVERASYLRLAADLCRVVSKKLGFKSFAEIYLAGGVANADKNLSTAARIAFGRGEIAFLGELLSWMLMQEKSLRDERGRSKILALYFLCRDINVDIRKAWLERLGTGKPVAENLSDWFDCAIYTAINNSLLSQEDKLSCTKRYGQEQQKRKEKEKMGEKMKLMILKKVPSAKCVVTNDPKVYCKNGFKDIGIVFSNRKLEI